MTDYHPVTKLITGLIAARGMWFETFEHEAVLTSEDAAKTRPGYSLEQGAKAMIVRVKNNETDKRFAMLVFPAHLKFDNKKVKALLGVKDIRFATPEEIAAVADGIQIGAVPPFGNLFGLEVIADPGLFRDDRVVFNAGDRRYSVAMKSLDYRLLVNPRVADITQAT